jgi:hypothetical protein
MAKVGGVFACWGVYVLVPASWAASMSAGGCPVSQLLSKASMSAVDENYTVYFVITFS